MLYVIKYMKRICLGSAYTDKEIFKMSALRRKKLLQKEIIGMSNETRDYYGVHKINT